MTNKHPKKELWTRHNNKPSPDQINKRIAEATSSSHKKNRDSEEYAGTPLLLDTSSSNNSLVPENNNHSQTDNKMTAPHHQDPTTVPVKENVVNISWANPQVYSSNVSSSKTKTAPTTVVTTTPKKKNLPPPSSSKKRSYQRSYSSYGTEDTWEERWCEANIQHVCELWSLSDVQLEQLRTMKETLADVDHFKNSPYEVIKFIMGPQGYDHTEQLFREMVQWRLDHDMDTLLETYQTHKLMYDHFAGAVLKGYDKDGDPICFERAGVLDGYGLYKRYGTEKCVRHYMWMRELFTRGEWIEEFEQQQGRPPTRVTILYDFLGLNSSHLKTGVFQIFQQQLQFTQRRYNGMAKRIIIIRAPTLFSVGWSMIKHLFPKKAQDKMVITSNRNYLDVLAKYVDLDVLPPCVYPEGKGTVAIGMNPRLDGGPLPEEGVVEDPVIDLAIRSSSGVDDDDASSLGSTTLDESSLASTVVLGEVRCQQIASGCWTDHVVDTTTSPSEAPRAIKVCCWREIS